MFELFMFFAAVSFTPGTIALLILAALVASLIGGVISGIKIAGPDLGNEMAALMGGLYGVIHALPAVIIGLIVLFFF